MAPCTGSHHAVLPAITHPRARERFAVAVFMLECARFFFCHLFVSLPWGGHSVVGDTDIVGKHNLMFMSTGIVGGRAKGVVIATGMHTALGHIQKDVQDADNNEDTPLQKKIGEFGNQLQVRSSLRLAMSTHARRCHAIGAPCVTSSARLP